MAIIIVGGVSACGKTTCGRELSRITQVEFIDADDLQPPHNVAKMHGGHELTDDDREPWLECIEDLIRKRLATEHDLIIACSVLKRNYRKRLLVDVSQVRIAFLELDKHLAQRRALERKHHYFPALLVASQYGALDYPRDEEGVVVIDAGRPVAEVTNDLLGIWEVLRNRPRH